jgi:hypothetical protein
MHTIYLGELGRLILPDLIVLLKSRKNWSVLYSPKTSSKISYLHVLHLQCKLANPNVTKNKKLDPVDVPMRQDPGRIGQSGQFGQVRKKESRRRRVKLFLSYIAFY